MCLTVNNIGPQNSFPVPEGIFNYQGTNYVAMTVWAQSTRGAQISNLTIKANAFIQSGFGPVALSPMSGYQMRQGAY